MTYDSLSAIYPEGWRLDTHIEWIKRDVRIKNTDGNVIFEQRQVEVPVGWSQTATNILASRYFKIVDGEREYSLKQVIKRIVDAVAVCRIHKRNLEYILVHQIAAFNSPVWFNLGVQDEPQTSACFILSVDDSLDSIFEAIKTESKIFKDGSGSGVNFSKLRGKGEPLSGGGVSSGVVSFLKVFDAGAGSIKSGGTTRRAAKMVILDDDHPDVMKFIDWKIKEEQKAKSLLQAGYSNGLEGEAYSTVSGQNSNNTIRISDNFMRKYIDGGNWDLKKRKGGVERIRAYRLMDKMAEGIHVCGDPGVQFQDTINHMNTVSNTEIRASNPCSEFLFLDNSACNLSSVNLVKFAKEYDEFDIELLRDVVHTLVVAQDNLIDISKYPTKEIKDNSIRYRPLGVGYANLATLLHKYGLKYDSPDGRQLAGAIMSAMTAFAYEASILYSNRNHNEPVRRDVIERHQYMSNHEYIRKLDPYYYDASAIDNVWSYVVENYEKIGNFQVTLLAPTGTIGLLMDCESTGIEPVFANKIVKKVVGGDEIEFENEHEDTAMSLSSKAHIDMIAAVQPHLSGGISKTVNLKSDTTKEEIKDLIVYAWKSGVKSLSFYRDGSKGCQPLTDKDQDQEKPEVKTESVEVLSGPTRRRLPSIRESRTARAMVGNQKLYLHCGQYEDGSLGEIFVDIAKEGATLRSIMNAFAISVSLGLQYGVPLEAFTSQFIGTNFAPNGMVLGYDKMFTATSLLDFIFQFLKMEYGQEVETKDGINPDHDQLVEDLWQKRVAEKTNVELSDEFCTHCGGNLKRAGTCFVCVNCGETTGCS